MCWDEVRMLQVLYEFEDKDLLQRVHQVLTYQFPENFHRRRNHANFCQLRDWGVIGSRNFVDRPSFNFCSPALHLHSHPLQEPFTPGKPQQKRVDWLHVREDEC